MTEPLEPMESAVFLCPDCGGAHFLEGPHGGLSVNFCCLYCWARFNDMVMFIQRTGRVKESERKAFQRGRWIPRTTVLED